MYSISAFSSSGNCFSLIGNFGAIPETYPNIDPASLQIFYDDSSQSFKLTYGEFKDSRYRIELYHTDGLTHVGGSRWTGKNYTAICSSGVLTIINDFSFEYPGMIITRTLSSSNDILSEDISLPDGYSRLQGQYKRVR